MSRLLCKILGHRHEQAYGGSGAFFRLTAPWLDGIGRSHRDVYARCERCGEQVHMGQTIDSATSAPRN